MNILYMRIVKSYFIICFFLNTNYLIAQENLLKTQANYDIGLLYGRGSQVGVNVNYNYQVDFFLLQYSRFLKRQKDFEFKLLIQPQYNKTRLKESIESCFQKGYEFGVNYGLLIRKKIIRNFLFGYSCLSLGPHFVSITPERQSNGFIFSDNLFMGFQIKVITNTYLDIRIGFRHISNASIKKPNGGINNSFVSIGFINLKER